MDLYDDDRAHEDAAPGTPHLHRIGATVDVCVRHDGEIRGYRVIDDIDGGYAVVHVHDEAP